MLSTRLLILPPPPPRHNDPLGSPTKAHFKEFPLKFIDNTPPLVDSDLISLGLKPHDTHPTPSPAPDAQVTVETYLVGRHELGVRIVYVTGSPEDSASKGYRIWHSVIAPGETPPARPEDLRQSFYTQRKKDLIEFEFGDSGKTAYFAVQIENDGKKGPWGPIVSALIP